MNNMVIFVISIVLGAALAVASIFYGGSAWSEGQTNAQATTLMNQAQQIAGAADLFRANVGTNPANIGSLTEVTAGLTYLNSLPNPSPASTDSWALAASSTSGTVTLTNIQEEVCTRIAARNMPPITCANGSMTYTFR